MKCLSKMIIHNCCSSLDYFLILMMAQNLKDFLIAISNNRWPRWKLIFTVKVFHAVVLTIDTRPDTLTDCIRLTTFFPHRIIGTSRLQICDNFMF